MIFFSKHPTPKANQDVKPPDQEVTAQMDDKDLLIQQLQQKIAELEQKLAGDKPPAAEEKVVPPEAEDPAPEKEAMTEEDRIKAIVRDIPKSMSDLALKAISSGWSHSKAMKEALTRATRERAIDEFSAEGKIVPMTGVQQEAQYKALLSQAAAYGNQHRGRGK